MTDISKLGEFGLIDRLTKDIKPKNDSTIYGVGDDCAVLTYPHTRVLTTTDMLMEGVHFDLTYITMQQLGCKAAMVNLSDVFAMNGSPRQLLVSLAVDKRFDVEVSLNGAVVGKGTGSSKKRAEQDAARAAIENLFPGKL